MQFHHRTHHCPRIIILIGVIAVMVVSVVPATGQIQALNDQIERIDAMIRNNNSTQRQFRAILGQLAEMAGLYGNEIRDRKKGQRIRTLKGAQADPRLKANLRLLQRIGAYETLLNRRLTELNAAKERLRYLRRRAVDDIKLMQTLAGSDADALLGQIDEALDRNQMLMDRPVVNAATFKPLSVETAWRRALAQR